ncbi:guanine nucleotide-binding protein-like 3 homolog [Lepeophtheirus salmonis]|uniref:guanine nucleotide-binding protein-like 3 homolog n=1 Tax=Lepeophtheirus salmonis TaxID=72036 RepID=UPI001AEA129D|nr:guanine nucleotide-binding protein-like 3 homolog [Lepeophtheirus salmonis]
MKQALKKRTKRVTTRERVKREKKKREYERKVRRDKKAHPEKYRKSKKDPGVPKSCPFKEEILLEAIAGKQAKENEKLKRREEIQAQRALEKANLLNKKREKGYEGLIEDAQAKTTEFEKHMGSSKLEVNGSGLSDKSAKAYYKEFRQVLERADVILQVLDARDPLGTRSREVEETILNAASKKRLVLVLNKADLIPKANLEAWIRYLRRVFPTVAFKCSTQSQGSRLGQSNKSLAKSSDKDLQTSKCIGADSLICLLSNYCRNKDVKTSIRVGIVGLPNVGKSSLINSLKRSRACNVGSTPGLTKNVQEVQLDSKIKLLDSPGMILASGPMSDASIALKNAVRVESLEDPITPVEAILSRCNKQQFMLKYNISEYEDTNEFLNLIAKAQGKVKKGGIPDRVAAARIILQDWNGGKIKYFTHPPEYEAVETHVSSEIVSEFSSDFKLDQVSFDKMESDELDRLPDVLNSDTMQIESSGIVNNVITIEDMEMDSENILPNKISIMESEAVKKSSVPDKNPKFINDGNLKLKKLNKIREKKEKKQKRRKDGIASDLAQGMESAFNTLTNEAYNFDEDFDK